MSTETKLSTSGIGARDRIGYAMGDVGSLLIFGLVQSVLQKYYTDVLGISIVSIMWLFVAARIWDAVNDPIWGHIVDGARVRPDGRYRRWLKLLAVPAAVSAVLMFIKLPGLTSGGYFIWACVTYILFGMLYTGVNIPYGSLAQVITSDDRERASLSVFRSVGSTLGAIPAMLLISLCYVTVDGVRSMSYRRILIGVCAIAVLSVAAYLICYRCTKERVVTAPVPGKGLRQTMGTVKQLFRSRAYIAVCLAGMLFLAAQMFAQSYYTYLFDYYFNTPGLSMMPTVCQYLPVVVIMFFAGKMGSRFGRRDICAWGMALAGAANLILYVMNTTSVWAFLAVCFLSGVGSAFMFLLVWALAADAIDYNGVHLGIHEEATSYAFFTFMRKLGQTVSAVLVNAVLLHIGYSDNVLNTANITSRTLRSMYSWSVLIPAVLYLLIFVILQFLYPLGRKQMEALRAEKEGAM